MQTNAQIADHVSRAMWNLAWQHESPEQYLARLPDSAVSLAKVLAHPRLTPAQIERMLQGARDHVADLLTLVLGAKEADKIADGYAACVRTAIADQRAAVGGRR